MPQRNDASLSTPQNTYERARLANVHPASWSNPKSAGRYELVIVGAGPAGVVAAEAAAALGAKVALVERHLIGGTCLNTGCVPSKSIIRTSRLYAEMGDAKRYGRALSSLAASSRGRFWLKPSEAAGHLRGKKT